MSESEKEQQEVLTVTPEDEQFVRETDWRAYV